MYNCKYCGKEFKNKGNLRKHEKYTHEESAYKFECPYCGKKLTAVGVAVHIQRCSKNPDRVPTTYELKTQQRKMKQDTPGKCKFCGKNCHNQNSLRNHERVCKKNPNRQLTIMESKEWQEKMRSRIDYNHPWNKGKKAADDSRIFSGDAARQRALQCQERLRAEGRKPGYATTTDKELLRRKRISKGVRSSQTCGGKRHGSGRGKKGWYKGFFCDSTYELVYIIYNLDNGIKFKRCNRVYIYQYKGESHKYYPDFELADGTIIEIKGYYSEVVDIKAASVTDRPIKILYEKDLQYAFDWVRGHYIYDQLSDLYE